jgi:hypothetical protein
MLEVNAEPSKPVQFFFFINDAGYTVRESNVGRCACKESEKRGEKKIKFMLRTTEFFPTIMLYMSKTNLD